MTMTKIHVFGVLFALQMLHVSQTVYVDYYYSNYDEEMRSQMFIPGASLPPLHVPFTIAVLNLSYCDVALSLIAKANPVYQRMMIERNVHLRVACNYTEPLLISQAIQLYQQLKGTANTLDGVDALMGDYNPLVSTIASSLNLTFIIVNTESSSLNVRLQDIMSVYSQSPPGSTLGTYSDLNNNTFVVDTFWYRSFLYSGILDPTVLGQQVFGSQLQNFLQIGIICDDAVLLSQFVVVDKGPFVTSLVTFQLDNLYPVTPASLNNVSASSMDSWASSFTGVDALIISINSTYSMMMMPQILQSLLNVGYYTPQTVTVLANFYIDQSSIIQYTDLQSYIYGTLNTETVQAYVFPFSAYNVTLSFPGYSPSARLIIDPVTQSVALGLYYFSMQLLQVVYKQSYLAFAIQTQNWLPIVRQSFFMRYSVTFVLTQLQYNRCSYISTVLQVQPSNCSNSDFQQMPFGTIGTWTGSNLITDLTFVYKPAASNSTSHSSSTTINSTSTLANKRLLIGIVIDDPWIMSCQECEQSFAGYALDLLGNLSLILKFNYTLSLQTDYQTLMAKLAAGHLDLGLGGIVWTNSVVATYGYNVTLMAPFLDSGVNVLMRNDTGNLWWTWLSPFSNVTWYTMLILAVILTFAFMILDTIDPNRLGKRLLDFFASYWFVFGSFTQSAVEIMPVTISTRLLSMIMWFFVIIYVSSFTAAYTSALLIEDDPAFVSSLPAALNYYRSSSDPYYFIANSSAAQFLSSSSYSDLYARAIKSPSSYVVKNVYEAAGHLLGRFNYGGFIGDARVNQWMSNELDCWLVAVGDIDAVYATYYSIIALPPNTTYYTSLRREIINLRRLRVLEAMKQFYFDSQCSSGLTPSPLNLDHLAGLYISLAVGCAVSLVATAIVVVIKKLQLRTARETVHRQRPFHFSHLYVAKILVVQNNGLLLKIYKHPKDERREQLGKKPELAPIQYSMLLADLNIGHAKTKKPHEMGLREGHRIMVKYLGVNPDNDQERFMYYKSLEPKFTTDD